jgi:predicted AAA+ superfamily ATPase
MDGSGSPRCPCRPSPVSGAPFPLLVPQPPARRTPYLPRLVDAELRDRLARSGAVVVEGPRACGKTETARQVAASEVLLDVDAAMQEAARVAPELVLDGPTPRLLDEWQVVPDLWNHVRRAVDARRDRGQFILTGSAVPADDLTRHTGAGRVSHLRMRPMSLFESGHANGSLSLAALLQGDMTTVANPGLTVPGLVDRAVTGGWPRLLGEPVARAAAAVRDYLDEVRRVDIARVDGVRRDPDRVARVMASLARNVATPVASATIASDAGGADGPLKPDTVREYLASLERLLLVEDQPAWAPHLRSRSILRHAPKRHFVDPSLAVAAARATPQRLLQDLRWFGFLFESMVVRDLRVYAQSHDAEVRHYRDNTGLEVDAIVTCGDGRWAAFEVKLGMAHVDEAAEQLLRFRDRVDTEACGPPATLGVIVATGVGFTRPDGVAVIPIGALGP